MRGAARHERAQAQAACHLGTHTSVAGLTRGVGGTAGAFCWSTGDCAATRTWRARAAGRVTQRGRCERGAAGSAGGRPHQQLASMRGCMLDMSRHALSGMRGRHQPVPVPQQRARALARAKRAVCCARTATPRQHVVAASQPRPRAGAPARTQHIGALRAMSSWRCCRMVSWWCDGRVCQSSVRLCRKTGKRAP